MKEMKVKLGTAVLVGMFAVASGHAGVILDHNFSDAADAAGWASLYGSTSVGHLDTAGGTIGQGDWTDGPGGAAGSLATANQAAAIVAAGGTITGDGLLADGALLWDMQDATAGNEWIHHSLPGTRGAGEVLTVDASVYLNIAWPVGVTVRFYDWTGSTKLGSDEWNYSINVGNFNEVTYAPMDVTRTLTITEAMAGHNISVAFREWNNRTQKDVYFDNISVTSSIPEPATLGMVGLFGAVIVFVRKRLMI